uniref:Uncharacterized protein n=1 Tax=Arundo donax TaxID=35708 RepID=A0A0A8Y4F1_ARUDO
MVIVLKNICVNMNSVAQLDSIYFSD